MPSVRRDPEYEPGYLLWCEKALKSSHNFFELGMFRLEEQPKQWARTGGGEYLLKTRSPIQSSLPRTLKRIFDSKSKQAVRSTPHGTVSSEKKCFNGQECGERHPCVEETNHNMLQ